MMKDEKQYTIRNCMSYTPIFTHAVLEYASSGASLMEVTMTFMIKMSVL